ncbi:MAG TPA: radical SAM family heme chaperone HemW [Smithellaceae bacterium]|nr:radical SAM family heme chaperone HemW [Smithellaceae bacterium]
MTETAKAGLYIHIPFCLKKCGYCSFYSVASSQAIPEFLNAIIREMSFYRNLFYSFDTIYLGGGTPSLLTIGQINAILDAAVKAFHVEPSAEITVEANPGDLSDDYLKALKAAGVNRLNIGIQSFDDRILNFLGRRHTAREARAAFDAVRTAGFSNVGLDLIYGVSGQTVALWRRDLRLAIGLAPEHLSCYSLSLERATPLYRRYQRSGLHLPSEKQALDFFLATSRTLTDSGYLHYEVSNYARLETFRSRHNMKYWRHISYLGLGPAAHSFHLGRRWWNKADLDGYLRNLRDDQTPQEAEETLSPGQLALETLFLSLRTQEGIDLEAFRKRYGYDLLIEKKDAVNRLIASGKLKLDAGHLRPTIAGMAIADSLALI